jgi:hypothetical protein
VTIPPTVRQRRTGPPGRGCRSGSTQDGGVNCQYPGHVGQFVPGTWLTGHRLGWGWCWPIRKVSSRLEP